MVEVQVSLIDAAFQGAHCAWWLGSGACTLRGARVTSSQTAMEY